MFMSIFQKQLKQKKGRATLGCTAFIPGALSGTRTLGPLIKSQLLYQLS